MKSMAFQKVQQKITTERKQPKVFRIVPNFVKYAAAAAVSGGLFIFNSYKN